VDITVLNYPHAPEMKRGEVREFERKRLFLRGRKKHAVRQVRGVKDLWIIINRVKPENQSYL